MRRFITLCLFTFTVPYAVFGQEGTQPDIQRMTAEAREYLHDKLPKAQSSLEKNFPKTVQTMGTTLDALDPSAGSADALHDNPHSWRV